MTDSSETRYSSQPLCAGRVALVTGAAGQGMGRSIALTLAREGAAICVNYLTSRSEAETIVAHIEENGGQAIAVQADVVDALQCRSMVERVQDELGPIDICVIGPGGGWHPEPIDELETENILSDLGHEVGPLANLLPLVLPDMYERSWGRIIGIAMHPQKLSPAYSYNLGKAARAAALNLAADEAWQHGVTVNSIAPGPVSGIEAIEVAFEQSVLGPAWQSRADVSPQDIAEGVAFLCSTRADYVTDCVLPYTFRS